MTKQRSEEQYVSHASSQEPVQCPLCDKVHQLRETRGKKQPFLYCPVVGTNVFVRTSEGMVLLEKWRLGASRLGPIEEVPEAGEIVVSKEQLAESSISTSVQEDDDRFHRASEKLLSSLRQKKRILYRFSQSNKGT